MKHGILIALEGIDGSGTTTQCQSLAERLVAEGWSVHTTFEPSTGPVGQHIRRALAHDVAHDEATLALLFAADRTDHYATDIEPALEQGKLVLCDRYLLSSLAYQSVHLPLDWIRSINQHAPLPACSILLRVSPETAATRRHERGSPKELFDAAERQRSVAARYDEVFDRSDVGPTRVIDAEASLQAVGDELYEMVQELVDQSVRLPRD